MARQHPTHSCAPLAGYRVVALLREDNVDACSVYGMPHAVPRALGARLPDNPYHRLVKGYKLVSDSRNDPLRDARVALDLLADEIDALFEMQQADPGWLALLHHLPHEDEALDRLLAGIRRTPAPDAAAAALATHRFMPLCCGTRLARFAATDLRQGPADRQALAYALGWIPIQHLDMDEKAQVDEGKVPKD